MEKNLEGSGKTSGRRWDLRWTSEDRGQGPGTEDRWEGISEGGNSRGQSLGWVGASHIHRGSSALWMPAGNNED